MIHYCTVTGGNLNYKLTLFGIALSLSVIVQILPCMYKTKFEYTWSIPANGVWCAVKLETRVLRPKCVKYRLYLLTF